MSEILTVLAAQSIAEKMKSTTIDSALRFHRHNKSQFNKVLPFVNAKGVEINKGTLRELRNNIKLWRRRQISARDAILTIATPLMDIYEEFERKGITVQ